MKFSIFKTLAFQIFFYKGSHVADHKYYPLMDSLSERLRDLNITMIQKPYSFFRRNEFSDDTVVIGHSFGGYFALLDALEDQDNEKNLKGVVLLNGHFNSKKRAWYPGIRQSEITAPVLTIAGAKDKRLPLKKVLPDLWEKVDERLPNKFYKIYRGFSHFSGLSGKKSDETDALAKDIEVFIRSVYNQQMGASVQYFEASEKEFSYGDITAKIPHSIDFNHSLNFLDAIYRLILKRFFWEWVHNILFLLETPTVHKNAVFTDYGDHILIKSYNLPLDQVIRLSRESIPPGWRTRHEIITVPTNILGLYQWLLFPLSVRVEGDSVVTWPILCLHIKPNVTYYKMAHPRKILYKHTDLLS